MNTILRLVLSTVLFSMAGTASPASAAFNVTINTTGPQSGGTFSGRVWTPTAPSSVILVSNLLAQLEGGDVIINANGGGAEAGNITIASTVPLDDLVTTTGRTPTLNAQNDIAINAVITQSGVGGNNVPNAVSLVLNANSDSSGAGSVTQAANILTGGGGLLVIGVGFTQNAATTIDTQGGNIVVGVTGAVSLGGSTVSTGGGRIDIAAVSASTLSAAITTSGGAFNADVTGTGTLNINNDITTSGGDVDITTANGLLQTSVGSDVNASGGAGVAAVRLESLNGIADLVTGGSIASGSGGVRIAAGNNVTLSSAVSASGGPVILAADSNAGGVGTLTLNSAVSATGAGTISLTGLNFAQSGTGTVTSSGGSITVSFVSAFTISRAISSTSGSISISGGAVTLNAATSGGGGVSIIVPSIIGNAGGTITAQVKPITLMGSIGAVDIIGSIQSNGGNINVTAGTTLALGSGLTSSDGGVITLTSAGNMTLFGPMTTSGGAFNADVTGAGTLSIQNDISTSGADVDITTANGLLQTTAGSDVSGSGGAGSAAVRLEALNGNTDLTIASAITSGSGGVRLAAGNHVTVSGVVSGGGGPLTLAAETNASGLGTLTLNSAVSTTNAGAISLSGHGFVQAGTGTVSSSGGNITSHIVTAFSVSRSISSTSGVISMTGGAATLNASISGGGGVSIIVPSITGNAGGTIMSQAKPITLTGSSGAVDIIDVIDSNGGNISVNAATTLDLGSGFMSSGGGVITLTSVGNMALSGPMTT